MRHCVTNFSCHVPPRNRVKKFNEGIHFLNEIPPSMIQGLKKIAAGSQKKNCIIPSSGRDRIILGQYSFLTTRLNEGVLIEILTLLSGDQTTFLHRRETEFFFKITFVCAIKTFNIFPFEKEYRQYFLIPGHFYHFKKLA